MVMETPMGQKLDCIEGPPFKISNIKIISEAAYSTDNRLCLSLRKQFG